MDAKYVPTLSTIYENFPVYESGRLTTDYSIDFVIRFDEPGKIQCLPIVVFDTHKISEQLDHISNFYDVEINLTNLYNEVRDLHREAKVVGNLPRRVSEYGKTPVAADDQAFNDSTNQSPAEGGRWEFLDMRTKKKSLLREAFHFVTKSLRDFISYEEYTTFVQKMRTAKRSGCLDSALSILRDIVKVFTPTLRQNVFKYNFDVKFLTNLQKAERFEGETIETMTVPDLESMTTKKILLYTLDYSDYDASHSNVGEGMSHSIAMYYKYINRIEFHCTPDGASFSLNRLIVDPHSDVVDAALYLMHSTEI